jgi:hypothetical protein
MQLAATLRALEKVNPVLLLVTGVWDLSASKAQRVAGKRMPWFVAQRSLQVCLAVCRVFREDCQPHLSL